MRVVALLYATHAEVHGDDQLLFITGAAWSRMVGELPAEIPWFTVVVFELDEAEYGALPEFELRVFKQVAGTSDELYSELVAIAHQDSPPPVGPILYRYVLPLKFLISEACILRIVVSQGEVQLAEASFAVLTE